MEKKCHDCGGDVLPGQIKSRRFGVYLCIGCFAKRTGWDTAIKAAGDPTKSQEEVKALADKARAVASGQD